MEAEARIILADARREKARQGVKRLSNSADIWALERWFDLDKD
jgi:hypothetical protein